MWVLRLCVQCTWSSVLAVDDVVFLSKGVGTLKKSLGLYEYLLLLKDLD